VLTAVCTIVVGDQSEPERPAGAASESDLPSVTVGHPTPSAARRLHRLHPDRASRAHVAPDRRYRSARHTSGLPRSSRGRRGQPVPGGRSTTTRITACPPDGHANLARTAGRRAHDGQVPPDRARPPLRHRDAEGPPDPAGGRTTHGRRDVAKARTRFHPGDRDAARAPDRAAARGPGDEQRLHATGRQVRHVSSVRHFLRPARPAVPPPSDCGRHGLREHRRGRPAGTGSWFPGTTGRPCRGRR
jgi:hypothetical protein